MESSKDNSNDTASKISLPKFDEPIFDDDRNTKLHFAAAHGELEEVTRLLSLGHKIDIENHVGWTPLMMATKNGHLLVVKTLLDCKADVTRKNKFGGTVFLAAVASGNLEVLHVVLEHLLNGGVSRQSMESALSPLSMAILFNYEHMFSYLLGKGFCHTTKTITTGLTPMMFAVLSDNPLFSNILTSRGVDESEVNINGESAKDLLAKKKGVTQPTEEPQKMIMQQQFPGLYLYAPQQSFYPTMPQNVQSVLSNNSNILTSKGIDETGASLNGESAKDLLTKKTDLQSTEEPQTILMQQQQVPGIYLYAPQQSFYATNSPQNVQNVHFRKSSNVETPTYNFSPTMSPITPMGFYPQVFFPPDFSPSSFLSNSWNYSGNNPLNARMSPGLIISPVPVYNDHMTWNCNYAHHE